MDKTCDFSGWATRHDIRCADNRIIRKDAFKHNDGAKVPIVWNHQHNDVDNVLGHAILENREEGVYAYGYLNGTDAGERAKECIQHGDIESLSIFANQLQQNGYDVVHGNIRELSLVLAGANPGAFIDAVLTHSIDGSEENVVVEEANIFNDEELEFIHSETSSEGGETEFKEGVDEGDDDESIVHSLSDEQMEALLVLLTDDSNDEDVIQHSDDATVEDIFNSLSPKQKDVVYTMICQALEANKPSTDVSDTVTHNIFDKGDEQMKRNTFDATDKNGNAIEHSAVMNAIAAASANEASMKNTFLSHGIDNIDYLFPDAKTVTNTPEFIKRETGWVSKVMSAVHHTPFSRIKTVFADITEDQARAKGYIKGKEKKEEVFSLLRRTTTPQTIYKKQKLDRDDVIDITDFDVVVWLKAEMRMMLDEEIARAILIGDGRLASDEDKIKEDNIRPVWKDADLYTIKTVVDAGSDSNAKAKSFIRSAIKSRKSYKGSGEPTLYCSEDILTDCLLLEDNNGRIIYDSVTKLATTLRVKEIVTVEAMEDQTRTAGADTFELLGLIVNLTDYNVGADKGGAVNMFDDFDINYNKMIYLIETRCSGALIRPYAAIALEAKVAG